LVVVFIICRGHGKRSGIAGTVDINTNQMQSQQTSTQVLTELKSAITNFYE
jgi:hypothetical protein